MQLQRLTIPTLLFLALSAHQLQASEPNEPLLNSPLTKGGRVDFERQIQGLLGKLGCNAGSCHGSFQGKGGLYLSLFGYSAEKDFYSLTHDAQGRRINSNDPDQSLMLLKPTAQVSHGGGKRLEKNSPEYQLLRRWIADGANWTRGSGGAEPSG